MSDAIFKSGHEACRFAYAFSGQQYPTTIMARLMRGMILGSGRGLVGLDGAAIAGTVKRHVESMPSPSKEVTAARYELLRNHAMSYVVTIAGLLFPVLGTGGHNRRMVQELVMYYFRVPDENGKPVKLATLADKYGVHASTVSRAWRPIKERLREWDSAAQAQIDERLVEVGLIFVRETACNF